MEEEMWCKYALKHTRREQLEIICWTAGRRSVSHTSCPRGSSVQRKRAWPVTRRAERLLLKDIVYLWELCVWLVHRNGGWGGEYVRIAATFSLLVRFCFSGWVRVSIRTALPVDKQPTGGDLHTGSLSPRCSSKQSTRFAVSLSQGYIFSSLGRRGRWSETGAASGMQGVFVEDWRGV